MVNIAELNTGTKPDWCPGCGNFSMLMALKQAIAELGLAPEKTLIVSGIGCFAKLPHHVNTYGFHGIHGRSLPVATGAKLANHELEVIATGGDGDGYGIGLSHLIHAARRNLDMTYIVHNNQIYGLTTGQASPTSDRGAKTKTSPSGVIELPINPMTLTLSAGATFIARGFAGDPVYLKGLIMDGVKHRGFAIIDVLQPCVTFNKVNTYDWYTKRVYKLGPDHDPTSKEAAFRKALEWGDKIPVGVYYRETRPIYNDDLPQLERGPLALQPIPKTGIDITGLMDEMV